MSLEDIYIENRLNTSGKFLMERVVGNTFMRNP